MISKQVHKVKSYSQIYKMQSPTQKRKRLSKPNIQIRDNQIHSSSRFQNSKTTIQHTEAIQTSKYLTKTRQEEEVSQRKQKQITEDTTCEKQQGNTANQFKKFFIQFQQHIMQNYKQQLSCLNSAQRQIWMQEFLASLKQKNSLATIRNQQNREYAKFFFGNILQGQEFQQQFLYNVAIRYCGRIKSTKLIYVWNPLHKTNIHEYIDNKPNILLMVRTQENSILAAYTEMPFKKPFPDAGFGLLISLTNRKVFSVKKNQRAISYDGTYVSFGNYELLIKGNEISSNLGNAGGFFQSNGEKARILFNQGPKSTTKIAQLQVFQIQT